MFRSDFMDFGDVIKIGYWKRVPRKLKKILVQNGVWCLVKLGRKELRLKCLIEDR